MSHPSGPEAQPVPAVAPADPLEVCTLSADGMQERLAWIQREILPHHVGSERLVDGLALELVAVPGLGERLDHLIALERACCAPLAFERRPGTSPDRLRLEIRGVDPDAAVFGALRPPAGRRALAWRRIAGAAGVGSGVALGVCCLLPIAAVGLFGATSWLALDAPGVLLTVWVLGTGAAWMWRARRRGSTRDAGPAPDPRCGC